MPLLHVCHFVVALVTFEEPPGDRGCLRTPESNSMGRQRGHVTMQLLSSALTLGVGVGHHELGLVFWPPSLPLYSCQYVANINSAFCGKLS